MTEQLSASCRSWIPGLCWMNSPPRQTGLNICNFCFGVEAVDEFSREHYLTYLFCLAFWLWLSGFLVSRLPGFWLLAFFGFSGFSFLSASWLLAFLSSTASFWHCPQDLQFAIFSLRCSAHTIYYCYCILHFFYILLVIIIVACYPLFPLLS